MKTLSEILNGLDKEQQLLVEERTVELLQEVKKEEEDAKYLRHLDHAEDLLIRNKGKNFHELLGALHHTHNYLSGGRKHSSLSISTKMDGSPAIVFGHDPRNGKFFVGTKSFFNKTPKINYKEKDIEANHGKTPGLASRLKNLLHHLKKVVPPKGVFQGDLMYTAHEVSEHNGKLSFTPNTITYHVDKNSGEGRSIMKSKVGVAPHTEYDTDDKKNFIAKFGQLDSSVFKKSDDVHMFDTKVKGPFKYDGKSKKKFIDHVSKASEFHGKLHGDGAYDVLGDHEKTLLGYINATVKQKKTPSVEGYIGYLSKQASKNIEKVKLDKTKEGIKKKLSDEQQNIVGNKGHFNNLFQAHKHVQSAKNILVDTLGQNSPYDEKILGNKSKPEGFVVSINGKPMKFVDRNHFSAANFDWNEKVNPEDNPVVMHWGRFNPVTKGHEKMIEKGADIARRTGAKQMVRVSSASDSVSKDDKNNPLTPQEKLKWIKTLFPGQDVALAGHEAPTIIAQLQQLHHKGVKDVTIVAGSDRVPEYQRILAKYNGPDKLFHFNKARIVSSGERNPDAKGTEGVSGTKVREAAKKNDFHRFRLGLPSGMKEKDASELFKVIRSALKEKKSKK
ncbi:MAG TPA: DUF6267 family protein [Methylomirabilota bacterium]|nr:DUF6267 family protein [Methylomirabilota bacterium]